MVDDISQMTAPELERILIKYAQVAEAKGLIWADAKAVCESLEDKKKVVVAHAAGDAPLDSTEAKRERFAHASIQYADFLEGLEVARRQSNRAWVEYSSARDKFEAVRSVLSNRREEMKRGIT